MDDSLRDQGIQGIEGNTVRLELDFRTTQRGWFYWAPAYDYLGVKRTLLDPNPRMHLMETNEQIATQTLVLDRAAYRRQLKTGSLTAYALEFEGKDGKWIYALWTARAIPASTGR